MAAHHAGARAKRAWHRNVKVSGTLVRFRIPSGFVRDLGVGPGWLGAVGAAVGLAVCSPAAAQLSPAFSDPQGYCVPANTHHDPPDVRPPVAPPVQLPPGFTQRTFTVGGYSTPLFEGGPRDSREAVVFMHGNPGLSLDFAGLLRAIPRGTRVVAFDLLGFGHAEKPYDFPYDLPSSRPLADEAFSKLGLERVHLVGHDVGSVLGVDWAARHPERLASAVLIAGGILIGYQDHHFARVWKTPVAGEDSMRRTTREGFVSVLQAHNPRPLPREFVDRNYDAYDRATRCAILKAYRALPDATQLGREHAAALRPYDRPALVIWGDRDPFLPPHIAQSNREGFPSADVHVYENSGHWPFVDEEQRTVELMSAFFRRHVREQAGARIRLAVRPRRTRAGRRTRFRARAVLPGSPGQPVAGVVVRFGRRAATTGADGRAVLVATPRYAGRRRVRASKPPLAPVRVRVAVRGRRSAGG